MSLLHKAITLSGACAIGLTLAFAAPAAAEDAKPINFRAVGGAVLFFCTLSQPLRPVWSFWADTWNVGLTGVGKLVNDRYPGSAINVLQGASVSNPLRLEQNAADVTLTQTFNTVAARDGKAPYKKPLKNVASLANMNDTSRLSIIVSADLPVNTFDELMEKKLPVRLDRGAKGTLHNVVGAMLLAEYGYTYDDITKWGGAHTAVSANDRVGMFQDGTLNAYLTLGPGQQSHIQELVLNAKVKWLRQGAQERHRQDRAVHRRHPRRLLRRRGGQGHSLHYRLHGHARPQEYAGRRCLQDHQGHRGRF